MKTFSEHCAGCSDHHVDVGSIHKTMHDTYKAHAKGEIDAKERDAKLADCHLALATHHANHAVSWAELGKALEESPDTIAAPGHESNRGRGGDLDGPRHKVLTGPDRFTRVADDSVAGVVPDSKLTLVPRFGGPTGEDALSKVPATHRHLVTRES